MKNMKTPRTRAEFERNLNLLHRQIEDGKFRINDGLSRSLYGLARMRFLPNGRIDFLSVDESTRLQANMMNQFNEEAFQEQFKQNKSNSDASTEETDASSQPSDAAVWTDLVE